MGETRAKLLSAFWVEESGSELLEFSLSAVILFTLIFGLMQGSEVLYIHHYVAYAAREATRYAMVRGSSYQGTSCASTSSFSCDATASDITKFVNSIPPIGFSASNLTVTPTWPGTTITGATCTAANGVMNSPGCMVQVNIRYSISFNIPFMPATTLNVQSTSEVAILE